MSELAYPTALAYARSWTKAREGSGSETYAVKMTRDGDNIFTRSLPHCVENLLQYVAAATVLKHENRPSM